MGFVQAALSETRSIGATQSRNLVAEAVGHLERALAGGSRSGRPVGLGRLYVQTRQQQKAIPVLRAFLDDRPDYAEASLPAADA